MAKNLGREFATMDEDERRRFAMEAEGGTDAAPEELDFEDPREEQDADPEDRDGAGALLDEEAHRRAVERQRGRGAGPGPEAA
ncbi:MAG TPA: hypothetical protein VMN37_00955 [Gemmatimonadales bacterium]|nr:hypothetical protein [Gemmatimonadales bacterium]